VTSARPLVEIRSITKTYDLGATRVEALRGVDLSVRAGEMIAVMGASGSGKSTLMNVIGCLDVPTGGTYHLDGERVDRLAPDALADIRNRRIGFIFQGFNLLSRTTAVENVELPLLYAGVRAKERHRLSLSALEKVGLAERAHHVPSQLSGGQQQRVAIARSLVNHPSILLADEPTGNLDSRTSVEIMQVFQELNEQENLTIMLVTHEPDIAEYSKRIITFRDGHVTRDEAVTHRRIASEIIAKLPPVED